MIYSLLIIIFHNYLEKKFLQKMNISYKIDISLCEILLLIIIFIYNNIKFHDHNT